MKLVISSYGNIFNFIIKAISLTKPVFLMKRVSNLSLNDNNRKLKLFLLFSYCIQLVSFLFFFLALSNLSKWSWPCYFLGAAFSTVKRTSAETMGWGRRSWYSCLGSLYLHNWFSWSLYPYCFNFILVWVHC